jgi:hypothetical protein
MALAPSALPVASVAFALNLFTATSRADQAGFEKSTAANITAVNANIVALKESTAANHASLKESTAANHASLKESTAANLASLKESTDAKIEASNKILNAYVSIIDRMNKEASSKQQS